MPAQWLNRPHVVQSYTGSARRRIDDQYVFERICCGATMTKHSATTKPRLTIKAIQREAAAFFATQSGQSTAQLYGIADGKAVGTYLEHKFVDLLNSKYTYTAGNSSYGIDFPDLDIDMKVTSIKQPQSSSPFRSARQKIRGLGYSLLIFVYHKTDDERQKTAHLDMLHTIFVDKSRTADYQTIRGILEIINRDGNTDDLIAFMKDRNLPIDDVMAEKLASELLSDPPVLGYLTISNALQWRLQYMRVIEQAGEVPGVVRVR